jgi:hypothetical protein
VSVGYAELQPHHCGCKVLLVSLRFNRIINCIGEQQFTVCKTLVCIKLGNRTQLSNGEPKVSPFVSIGGMSLIMETHSGLKHEASELSKMSITGKK